MISILRCRGNPTFRDTLWIVWFVLVRSNEIFELDASLYLLGQEIPLVENDDEGYSREELRTTYRPPDLERVKLGCGWPVASDPT